MRRLGVSEAVMNSVTQGLKSYALILCCCLVLGAATTAQGQASSEVVKVRVAELHALQAKLGSAIADADSTVPELKEFKARLVETSSWYWGPGRMNPWKEMAEDLYRDAGENRSERDRTFQAAKVHAFRQVITEAAISKDWPDLSRRYFLDQATRDEACRLWNIAAANETEFADNAKAYLAKTSPDYEARISSFRQRFPFITDRVWAQARLDAMAEFQRGRLERAIDNLTPLDVKELKEQVKKTEAELNRIAPGWEGLEATAKNEQENILRSALPPGPSEPTSIAATRPALFLPASMRSAVMAPATAPGRLGSK